MTSYVKLVMCLAIVGGAGKAIASDTDFENSNCRGRSTVYESARFSISTSLIDGKSAEGVQRHLYLEDCLRKQRMSVIAMNSDSKGIILQDDHGFVESFPPGESDKITRCFYKVKKGTSVPRSILLYNGAISNGIRSFTPADLDELANQARPIVQIECTYVGL